MTAVPSPLNLPVFVMLSLVLSRSFCQAVTEVNRRSYPTLASFVRSFSASSPTCCSNQEEVVIVDEASVVSLPQLKTMLSSHNIQLFDVRRPDEYEAGRIPQAVNVPLDNLEESLQLSPAHFLQKFEVKAPRREDDNIVFHCRTGVRSSKALGIARQLGFNKARHYRGGYSEWSEQEGQ
ncbi:thiosulfate:glutathione sulfurtransferase [Kryptolebias marmoratus]|uniref:Thiosulfate:glutathione sulfurtransferase-like n=1 Tax=Kryptolebias marmoratus TaxID=37003 RepID=A0A3Q3A9W9_KRYMA|nr:thiosulfate:glutathione sulfurtransferase [Kryptolebias marmoratus]